MDWRHPVDSRAEGFQFIFIVAAFVAVRHEVKLYFSSVNFTVIIHQQSFQTAAVHNGLNMQDSYWFLMFHPSHQLPDSLTSKIICQRHYHKKQDWAFKGSILFLPRDLAPIKSEKQQGTNHTADKKRDVVMDKSRYTGVPNMAVLPVRV